VAWYNGHPYFRDLEFDLTQEIVAIVGVGNVAIDVARILALSPRELAATDMAPYAIEALSNSRVRDIYLLGRRGPAQAAFTNPEIKELGELEAADIIVDPAEADLDPVSAQELEGSGDRGVARKVEMLREYASREPQGRPRRLHLRFLVSPLELVDDGQGAVGGIRLARNRLVRTASGSIAAEATGDVEAIPAGLVFRSVGYRGSAVPGVPFDERWGVIRNQLGRVIDDSGGHVRGLYTAGWIKRGPSGVIGTNKPDAVETVEAMIEDARCNVLAALPASTAIVELIRGRECRAVSFEEWQRLDEIELAAGEACRRPRVKFTSVDEMLAALG
jgi:ferredoxin--NADP+ reductase